MQESKLDAIELNTLSFGLQPRPNFALTMGDDGQDVMFEFRVKKKPLNRMKYWLFCKFFPFRVTRWD